MYLENVCVYQEYAIKRNLLYVHVFVGGKNITFFMAYCLKHCIRHQLGQVLKIP